MPPDLSWTFGQAFTFSVVSYGLTFLIKDSLAMEWLRRILQRDGRYERLFEEWLGRGSQVVSDDGAAVISFDASGAVSPEDLEDAYAEIHEMAFLEGFFRKLFTCSFCTGIWSGLMLAAWQLTLLKEAAGHLHWVHVIHTEMCLALAGGVFSYIWDMVAQRLELEVSE